MCLGLAMVVLLAGRSLIKALLAMLVGLWLASIGTDLFTAQARFTFGQIELLGGIDFMVVAIGVFAIGEVLASIEAGEDAQMLPVPKGLRNLLPTCEELKACRFAFVNGSVIGFLLGVPAGRRRDHRVVHLLRHREGGVAATRRNSATARPRAWRRRRAPTTPTPAARWCRCSRSAFRAAASTAILLSALVLWGVKPGPLMMQESPDVFWGLVASMYIGNVMLLMLNLPLVPLFAQILRLPAYVLFPIILGISIVGAYSASGRLFDLGLLAGFGLLGYADAQAQISRPRR